MSEFQPRALTYGQLFVLLGSDDRLVGVALHRRPPKVPMVLLCGDIMLPMRPQRGLARLSRKQRRQLGAP